MVFSLVAFLVRKQVLFDIRILDLVLCLVLSMSVTVVMSVIVSMRVSVVVGVLVRMLVVLMAMVMIVLVLATQVVMSVTGVQDLHLDQVEDQTHDSDNKHDFAIDLGRLKEALCGFY